MNIFRLKNAVMNNEWGCEKSMTDLFGYANPDNKPMAELWMGAHPKASSMLITEEGVISLEQYIANNPEIVLGKSSAKRFRNRLPFLFKVLSAKSPLSIQSHPNKKQAEEGWKKECCLEIPLDAAHRNYKDDNHKPELLYAITPFEALNGFREFKNVISLFEKIVGDVSRPLLLAFKQKTNSDGLKKFYHQILTHEKKVEFIAEVLEGSKKQLVDERLLDHERQAYALLVSLNECYPNDIGIVSALILNYVLLRPGEAMFLRAGTPHAYLKGTALELMANSDNVLRGGLTPKHVDIPELLSTTVFEESPSGLLKILPEKSASDTEVIYKTPVDDFQFSILILENNQIERDVDFAEILFVVSGEVTVIELRQPLTEKRLETGGSCFISAACTTYIVKGNGKVARAITPIK